MYRSLEEAYHAHAVARPFVSALNRPLSLFLALMLVLTTLLMARPVFQPSLVESSTASILETYGQLLLSFEANQGQADDQVKFS